MHIISSVNLGSLYGMLVFHEYGACACIFTTTCRKMVALELGEVSFRKQINFFYKIKTDRYGTDF